VERKKVEDHAPRERKRVSRYQEAVGAVHEVSKAFPKLLRSVRAREEAKQLFRKVSAKAGFAMIGYTHTPVDAPGFATARVTFTEGEA
jgi:hypothetical protein